MKAIRFHYRPASYLLTRYSGRHAARVALGPLGSIRLDDIPEPALPGPDWVRVRPTLSGICGSDLSALTAHDSFTLEPFGAYPFTFGHENVGVIAERGRAVGGEWQEGQRVIVNPMLSCGQRGLEPCGACVQGEYGLCRRTREGVCGPGPMIGYSPGTGGGWSGSFVAHVSQLHAADDLPDDVAVLTDPFGSALRGVLLQPPVEGDVVLVIGAGTIGLLAIRALRATGWQGEVAVVGRHAHQRELAGLAGASRVFASSREAGDWAAALPGARVYRPTLAPAFVEGGPSLVYDSVGTERSLRDALALAAGGGRVVLVGAAARVRLDLTRLWYRNLTLAGIFAYGMVPFRGAQREIYSAALELVRAGALDHLPLVTHHFALSDHRAAIRTAVDKAAGVVKVVFQPESTD